ncbi:MAG: DUF2807 domain-containing protein [Saprospiraceae bacterium]|nr:DUF2807 domain-containing protein [Saprospiraceae bacterium]
MKTSNKILLSLIGVILISIFISILASTRNPNGSNLNSAPTTLKTELKGFHSIKVQSFSDITIVKGSPAILFEGDSLSIATHEVTEKDSMLEIRFEMPSGSHFSSDLQITLYTDDLRVIEMLGSGNLICKDSFTTVQSRLSLQGSGDIQTAWSGQSLDISLMGSGSISNSGTIDQMNISLHGSGDISTTKTKCKSAIVNLLGSGRIEVDCDESLLVNLTGNGDVIYSGNAKVQTNKTGHGEVTKSE